LHYQRDLRNEIAQEVKTALAQLESARVQVEAANLGVQLTADLEIRKLEQPGGLTYH
jgi:hypothetical protein